LSSSRRVKKGPGRRPQSAKRQRFMELRARGWSISAADREVGVSRTSANNGARGYKTYRRGEAIGFVPALDRLAVRQISDRYLSEEERIGIADLRRAGLTIRQTPPSLIGHRRRYPGSCAAIAAETASTGRSKPPLGGPTQSPSSPATDRQEPRAMRTDRRAARTTVEPATDRPAPATRIPREPVDAVVPRKHLRLSTNHIRL